MAQLEFDRKSLMGVPADMLAVFASKGEGEKPAAEPWADAAAAARDLGIDLAAELAAVGFTGEAGTVARIPTRGKAKSRLLLVVGTGKRGDLDMRGLLGAGGTAARNALKDSLLAIVVPGGLDLEQEDVARAVTEGAGLGAYAFTRYRTRANDAPSLERIVLLPGEGADEAAVRRGVKQGDVLVRATSLARDLVNTPPADKRPPALAERVAELARERGLKANILADEALEEGGFGGIRGVGQGSEQPPRLVELSYEPNDASGHVILVGKGITFDSGGLSLKPSDSMATMKSDMAGAAAIVGAMSVLRELGVPVRVTGLLALAENMPSGHAIRVSDVLTIRNGKTVEVMNTDAEGRLVLADALAYAAEREPDAIIDLATLTGAQIVALGNEIAAVMGSDDALVDEVRAAADAAGEKVWPLPLPDEYVKHLDSEVADLKNIGKPGQAGTIVAGLFLKQFTGSVPWAHLDIAGPSFTQEGDAATLSKGGTGFGVRTLVSLLQRRG
jgi:leucyl aminopeptidase